MFYFKYFFLIFLFNQFYLFDPFFIISNYFLLLSFLCFSIFFSCLLVGISYLLTGNKKKNIEKVSEYECGFEPFDNATRQPFTIHFYIVGILFLLFDVEICILFPWALLISSIGWYGFWLMFIFLSTLILGFIYEWILGVISWNSFSTITKI